MENFLTSHLHPIWVWAFLVGIFITFFIMPNFFSGKRIGWPFTRKLGRLLMYTGYGLLQHLTVFMLANLFSEDGIAQTFIGIFIFSVVFHLGNIRLIFATFLLSFTYYPLVFGAEQPALLYLSIVHALGAMEYNTQYSMVTLWKNIGDRLRN